MIARVPNIEIGLSHLVSYLFFFIFDSDTKDYLATDLFGDQK